MLAEFFFVLLQSTRLTDGRTDGQTDRMAFAYRASHYMQLLGRKSTVSLSTHLAK